MDSEEDQRKRVQLVGTFMTIPFVLAIPPIVGWYLGSWLDERWETKPYLMYVMLFLGVIAGAREFYRIVKKYGDKDHEL